MADCLYMPEASINILKTPWSTIIEINPEIPEYKVSSVFNPYDLTYRSYVVHNTFTLEMNLDISPKDIKELIHNLQEGISNNKWKIVIGVCMFFGACYVLGSIT